MSDIIFIYGLQVETIIGCFDHEKTKTQPLIFDIEMKKDFRMAAEKDDVTLTVNYAEVADEIRAFVENTCVELLETLAERLAQQLFKTFPVTEVMIKIQKPEAIPGLPNVGIIITREKS